MSTIPLVGLFWGDDHLEVHRLGALHQITFQPTRISDATFGIVDEAEQELTGEMGAMLLHDEAQFVGDLCSSLAGLGLFQGDPNLPLFHEEGDLPGFAGFTGAPLIRLNVFKIQTQERVEEVLDILLILNVDRITVFPTEAELSRDEVEAFAESSQPPYSRFEPALLAGWLGGRRGDPVCGGIVQCLGVRGLRPTNQPAA